VSVSSLPHFHPCSPCSPISSGLLSAPLEAVYHRWPTRWAVSRNRTRNVSKEATYRRDVTTRSLLGCVFRRALVLVLHPGPLLSTRYALFAREPASTRPTRSREDEIALARSAPIAHRSSSTTKHCRFDTIHRKVRAKIAFAFHGCSHPAGTHVCIASVWVSAVSVDVTRRCNEREREGCLFLALSFLARIEIRIMSARSAGGSPLPLLMLSDASHYKRAQAPIRIAALNLRPRSHQYIHVRRKGSLSLSLSQSLFSVLKSAWASLSPPKDIISSAHYTGNGSCHALLPRPVKMSLFDERQRARARAVIAPSSLLPFSLGRLHKLIIRYGEI